ncbi:MAG TPA: hypothetical protein VFA56_12825 [Gaiellaceae bacterium]|nr:hypothetical protein [Gaiellaceae bacterium]
MADIPDRIVLKRHRDLTGRRKLQWIRRGGVFLLTVFLCLGLANVFGQKPGRWTATHPAAALELYAPTHLRGGLLYEARFTITASRDVKNALLQLSPGWLESQTLNTAAPSPLGEASRNGDLLFTLGHIPAGQKYRLFLQFQVNPTNVGRRRADVTLYDGGTKLVTIKRTLTFFP